MTEWTRNLIERFLNNRDLTLFPSIIVGMQEEDNVAKRLRYKNMFKPLRNLCAHEPAVVTSQLTAKWNKNNVRIVISSAEPNFNDLVINMISFSAYMFDMYVQTKQEYYIYFWVGLMQVLYPDIGERYSNHDAFNFSIVKYGDTQQLFFAYQDFMFKQYGKYKQVNEKDNYYLSLYETNRKLFICTAFYNLFEILELFMSEVISIFDLDNIKGFLQVAEESGVIVYGENI